MYAADVIEDIPCLVEAKSEDLKKMIIDAAIISDTLYGSELLYDSSFDESIGKIEGMAEIGWAILLTKHYSVALEVNRYFKEKEIRAPFASLYDWCNDKNPIPKELTELGFKLEDGYLRHHDEKIQKLLDLYAIDGWWHEGYVD